MRPFIPQTPKTVCCNTISPLCESVWAVRLPPGAKVSNNRSMNLLRIVARPLLAAPFIADGVDALMRPYVHVERAAGVRPLIDKATEIGRAHV